MRLWIPVLIIITACKPGAKTTGTNSAPDFKPDFAAGPPTMVYKTKADYSQNVPIILSDDKSVIISYPAPTDLKVGESFSTPTLLNNGYLLDNRGINANVAFLKMTYAEYSKLTEAPDVQTLKSMIIDNDPLTELCNCGNKYVFKNPAKEINNLINSKKLRTVCKVVK